MWKPRLGSLLTLALALTLAPGFTVLNSSPAYAQQVRVVVDGSAVFFDQPPVVVGGRVLVPLRGVFEELGAVVEWNPATRTILANRGGVQVQVTIGSRIAYRNGQQFALDVPPQIVGGRTLVPLRFVSESLGAHVQWMPLSRTVMITSGAAGVPAPPPISQPPPATSPSVIEGSVYQVDAPNQRLFVQRNGSIHTIIITGNTAITRINAATGQGGAASLTDLHPGDQVTVTLDAQGRAMLVRATTREASGRISTVAGSTIVLTNGQVFTLSPDAQILVGGALVSRDALRAGMDVMLRLHPQTGQIVQVIAQPVAQPPQGQVRITALTHNASGPLRVGQTIRVELRGTPGGQATFDIFNVASGIPMQEVSPGVYRGTFTVQQGHNVANALILGHLRVGGQEAVMQAGTAVTFDAQPPVITGRFPQPGTTIDNLRPTIVINYSDQGSGVDARNSRLMVNGENVTGRATITETTMVYTPAANLSQGPVRVRAVLRDRAGNQTADNWTFTIGVTEGALLRAVTASPTAGVQPGQVISVTAIGQPGGQATFTIEGVQQNIPMAEVSGQPGVYTGQFTIQPNHDVQNARILVTLTRGGQTQTVAATSRLSTVGARGPTPTITAPGQGTRVNAPIVIRGTAPPGSQVVVRVDYEGTLLFFNMRGTYGEVRTTANANGVWQVSINPTIHIPNARLTITAVAIDQAGRQSQPAQVQVTQG